MEQAEMVKASRWQSQVLLIGAIVGALTGVLAAYLLVSRSAEKTAPPKFSAGEGVKLGLLLLGLVRQVAQIFD